MLVVSKLDTATSQFLFILIQFVSESSTICEMYKCLCIFFFISFHFVHAMRLFKDHKHVNKSSQGTNNIDLVILNKINVPELWLSKSFSVHVSQTTT